ncbi:MAG: hypothetical protein QW117_02590 [Candidatus Pacearchaeota archaeon]
MNYKNFILFSVLLFLFINFSIISAFDVSSIKEKEGEIPEEIGKLLGNQRINVYVDNSFVLAVEIISSKFYIKEKFEKPTLEIYTTSFITEKIEKSDNPTKALLEAYKNGEIKIVKKTFLNKVKFFFGKFFLRKFVS